eukprot:7974759-Ditylum_brightwellii.AAC.1
MDKLTTSTNNFKDTQNWGRKRDQLTCERTRSQYVQKICYCWSCDITCRMQQTSENCKWEKEGHKNNATLENRMGETTWGLLHRGGKYGIEYK